MGSERKNMDIEELFRSKLENAEVIPDALVKQTLMKRLAKKEFMHFNPAKLNIYYLAGASVAIAALAFLLLTGSAKKQLDNNIEVNKEIKTDSISIINAPSPEQVQIKEGTYKKHEAFDTLKRVKMSSETTTVDMIKAPATMTDTLRKTEASVNISEGLLNTNLRMNISASFTAIPSEGCIPLKVKFSNTSTGFNSCEWSFGDGGTSFVKEPEWVYNIPGEYTVTLKIFGTDGSSSYATGKIKVNAPPSARFDIQVSERESADNEIRLINYSDNAVRYKWDFGDGKTSTVFEPVHQYEKSGKYNIKLIVWNDKGCADTASIIYSSGSSAYYIEFPNAFIPNMQGPTGGYYSASSDASAHIFHPVANGVVDYNLKIFSRAGVLIFETNDINIGWDGYNKGNLCEPGVYIWKVTGRYKNGETFTKTGDVILIKYR